jgi:putative flavoprotein involved in K+ transport
VPELSVTDRDTVIIGGGQAGLAIGYFLAQQRRDFTILEAGTETAAAWRTRWDSLRLFTPVRYDSLPGLAFPGDPDSYPHRDDVIAYLDDYVRRFELPLELDSRVLAIRAADGGFLVELADRRYAAEQVVIGIGPFQVPFTPPVAAGLAPDVTQMHSSDYRRPDRLRDGPVVVVGGGNTGYQLAEELIRSHEVHLAIGARQTPLPQCILGRDVFRYLQALRLMDKTVDSRLARRLKDRETLIGSSARGARRRGIILHPRVTGAGGSTLTFADGTRQTAATVIWATGFRLDHSFVELPVFEDDGQVRHRRGITDVPGLYFLGLPWLHTRGSALLGWVKNDAQYIADRIADRAGSVTGGIGETPETTSARLDQPSASRLVPGVRNTDEAIGAAAISPTPSAYR